jgi:hypothetical protein
VGTFPWTRLTACLAIPASTVLLASATGGGTTVARILGQTTEPGLVYAAPMSPGGGSDGLEPPVEIPASALDKANGARRFSLSSVLLSAYQSAVERVPESCHLSVPLLAAIGQVESGSLVGRTLDDQHRVTQPVLGPVLNGNGFAAVADTDDGSMDGDTRWDRAMGPMQFIPSTWRTYGVDADGDGAKDPQDVDDAAASAAAYLCAGGRDLGTEAGERDAVLSYNNSQAYYFLVLRWKEAFENASSLVIEAPDTSSAAVSVAAGALLAPQGAPASPGPSVAPAPRPTAAPSVSFAKASRPSGTASPSGQSGSGSSGSPSDPSAPSSPTTGSGGTSTHGTPSPTGTPTHGFPSPGNPTTPTGPTAPADPGTPTHPSTSGDGKSGDDKSGDDKSGSEKPGNDKSGSEKPGNDKPDDRGQEAPETPDCAVVDEMDEVDGATQDAQAEQVGESVDDENGLDESSDDSEGTDGRCAELSADAD